MIVCDMLSSNVAEDFDRAYIFSSSMTSRLKSDMCACFLKLGYGIHEDATSVLVVNLDDDNKFFGELVIHSQKLQYKVLYPCRRTGQRESEDGYQTSS